MVTISYTCFQTKNTSSESDISWEMSYAIFLENLDKCSLVALYTHHEYFTSVSLNPNYLTEVIVLCRHNFSECMHVKRAFIQMTCIYS